MKQTKKGFTLVELLVVIAILAILATVSVVGYTAFIQKAHQSNDRTLVAQLNKLIMRVDGEKYGNFHEVVETLQENGIDVTKLNATAKDYEILWDMDAQEFFYTADQVRNGLNIWIVSETLDTSHSTYYVGDATTIETTLGFDAGTSAVNVVFKGTDEVIIRTNGGNLTVESGNVTHYGVANLLTVADSATYVEKGTCAADQDDYTNAGDANSEYVYVIHAEDLREKLADSTVQKIALACNIGIESELAPNASSNFDFKVNRAVEINLNGYNITSTHTTNEYSFTTAYNNGVFLVEANGVLTLTGAGEITLRQNGNMEWSALSAVIATRGDVVVDGAVRIAHLGGTSMSYGIDMWAWGADVVDVTINAGTVHSVDYRAIRLYHSGGNYSFNLTVNGGVVSSANNSALMLHGETNSYTLNLNGGFIMSNGYTSSGTERLPVAKMTGTEVLTYNITNGQLIQNGVDVTAQYK